jgi:tetratricopeptide (TPR) repeat protein
LWTVFPVLLSLAMLGGCAETSSSKLPPSESDLTLLTTVHLCGAKEAVLGAHGDGSVTSTPWGSGEELRVRASQGPAGSEESYFVDEDGVVVGALFVFPAGLKLKPFPVLRKTLSELRPALEFYLSNMELGEAEGSASGTLFMTGDEKTTTQYVVTGEGRGQTLMMASFTIDPYAGLMAPQRPEFVARVTPAGSKPPRQPAVTKPAESFLALQELARGQANQLGFCGERDYGRAAGAFQKALTLCGADKVCVAESHHRLGMAMEGQGKLEAARDEMERSLTVRPNTPEVLNNLGAVYGKLGDRDQSIKTLERAVTLRPNYPLARYNLAEAYEAVNVKRAILEYQTYMALVEGMEEEADRVTQAKQRVKALKR